MVAPGEQYRVRGLNKADGEFVQIEVAGAEPNRRWVARDCGRLDAERPIPGPTFAAFFDDVDAGRLDPTPPPPRLDGFDRAVLAVCGDWGSRPSRNAFRAMLDEPALKEDVEAIYEALEGAVLAGRVSPQRFKDQLTDVWFEADGFRHVFCGEPYEGELGGLHFHGRYLQMQERSWGGPAACPSTEIAPPVYTIGVAYRTVSGRIARQCPKGYALDLGARAILVAATRGLKALAPQERERAMCLARLGGGAPGLAVVVARGPAIRTFYPDASPSCDRARPARECLCER